MSSTSEVIRTLVAAASLGVQAARNPTTVSNEGDDFIGGLPGLISTTRLAFRRPTSQRSASM